MKGEGRVRKRICEIGKAERSKAHGPTIEPVRFMQWSLAALPSSLEKRSPLPRERERGVALRGALRCIGPTWFFAKGAPSQPSFCGLDFERSLSETHSDLPCILCGALLREGPQISRAAQLPTQILPRRPRPLRAGIRPLQARRMAQPSAAAPSEADPVVSIKERAVRPAWAWPRTGTSKKTSGLRKFTGMRIRGRSLPPGRRRAQQPKAARRYRTLRPLRAPA